MLHVHAAAAEDETRGLHGAFASDFGGTRVAPLGHGQPTAQLVTEARD